jgi:GWxTD domain-containing protein
MTRRLWRKTTVSLLAGLVATTVAAGQGKRNAKLGNRLREELATPYRTWLDNDVAYIITDSERAAFNRLRTDEEREQFVEQFWLRRDPTPDTAENEAKEEHYRRIAYANERFASGIPGWKTDRGRVYIRFGPPDEIESHPGGERYQRPAEQGGGSTVAYPFETWRYRFIEGLQPNVTLEFIDSSITGEYRLAIYPGEKDALAHVSPGATGTTPTFEQLEMYVGAQKPPPVRFKDLETAVDSRVTYNALPLKMRADYAPVTNSTVVAYLSLQFQNADLGFQLKDGMQRAVVNVYARITTITRRPVTWFEDTVVVETTTDQAAAVRQRSSVYQKAVPLAPGSYRLNIVAKDVLTGAMSTHQAPLVVAGLEDGKFSASSLFVADAMEKLPVNNVGTGQFVIGDMKVRSRVDATFHTAERLGLYMQVYNFASDERTGRFSGEVEYDVIRNGTNETVLHVVEDSGNAQQTSNRFAVQKLLALDTLAPGQYTVRVRILDRTSKQIVSRSAAFSVI